MAESQLNQLIVASNRGPLAFERGPSGTLVPGRGGGGLVASLGPALAGTGATWAAGAISRGDRQAAGGGPIEAEGFRVQLLDLPAPQYRQFYNVVSNATLWFLYHGLFDHARRPRFDKHWRGAWEGYRAINSRFAEAVATLAAPGATVLIHDFHLSLVPGELASRRPDLRTVHFHHTPFPAPDGLRVLPDAVRSELMSSLAAASACGFHARRWAAAFEACCDDVLGVVPPVFVSPAAVGATELEKTAASERCETELAGLEEQLAGRQVIVRVDRIELSKNLLRGFLAYDELLEARPDLRGRVVFAALVYPTRQGLPEYQAYRQEVEGLARRLNQRWGGSDWTPVLLDLEDNYPRSVAALRRADVLLVNPVRDGLNLVAKEGPLVNERHGVLVLSREAGVWDELSQWAIGVNPFDVTGTAEAMGAALDMAPGERAERAEALRRAAARRSPEDWLADQLAAARPRP